MAAGGSTLYFTSDTVTLNGTNYYYVKNLQGNIVAILNSSGTAVVQYTYNAWGKVLSITGSMATTLGTLNPLRYRGYVYDQESGLYYLQSRYYNPEMGRFINADILFDLDAGLQGYNIFLYCANDPIGRIDIIGADSEKLEDLDLADDEVQERGGGGNGSHSGGGGGTRIYRYGYSGSSKLVPTQDDVDSDTGLSFSLRARPGSAMTTIEEVNSTGELYAVQDGKYHVSVYPLNGTIKEWHYCGVNSVWTQALSRIVVRS